MDGLHPPFYVTVDVNSKKPIIWTERGNHLVATIEHESEGQNSEAIKLAHLFKASPLVKAVLSALLAAGYTREFTDEARAAIQQTES
jgi:hypothetical protein